MKDIKEFIINKSKELNIDIIGFTNCEPLFDIKEYLEHRRDNNTEFEETDIEKRINPKITLPNCKSIILIGLSYNIDYENNDKNILKGNLSKSSWGRDYHKVLKDKIEKLINEIKNELDFDYKYFVDTGPLVDRELAKKAGVGFYGKNCSIINREYGSFIFLGYILTDLDINIDIEEKELEDDCGDCDLCIKACPTGALIGPYQLNPKKCISYLTQTKDNIPEELLEKMATKIYGCDTCQLVCPKNKDVKKSIHREFVPELTNGIIDIEELLTMSNRQFKEKYASMAGSWRGKNILKRNAIIALGNMKDKKNMELLIEEKNKDNQMLNPYIKWALNKIMKD